jgi:hypothetical protein
MTIRLLCAYERYPVNAIVSLDAGTEAGLIASKQALADTTGGVLFVPAPGPIQSRSGAFSVDGGRARLILLLEGLALLVSGSTGTAGSVARLDATGSVIGSPTSVGPGATPQIGPYSGSQTILITCTAGRIDATVTDAAVNAAQISTSAPGIVAGLSGPEGFIPLSGVPVTSTSSTTNDASGRPQLTTKVIGGVTLTWTRTYDAQGRPATVAFNNGTTIKTTTYAYDAASGAYTGETVS